VGGEGARGGAELERVELLYLDGDGGLGRIDFLARCADRGVQAGKLTGVDRDLLVDFLQALGGLLVVRGVRLECNVLLRSSAKSVPRRTASPRLASRSETTDCACVTAASAVVTAFSAF
jgi:hypothetical protein